MICADIIVGEACMAHSAVEEDHARLIVQPERRGVYLFFILFTLFLAPISTGHIFLLLSFSEGNTSLSRDIVATILFSFYTLSISIRTVVERGVYVIVPISHT